MQRLKAIVRKARRANAILAEAEEVSILERLIAKLIFAVYFFACLFACQSLYHAGWSAWWFVLVIPLMIFAVTGGFASAIYLAFPLLARYRPDIWIPSERDPVLVRRKTDVLYTPVFGAAQGFTIGLFFVLIGSILQAPVLFGVAALALGSALGFRQGVHFMQHTDPEMWIGSPLDRVWRFLTRQQQPLPSPMWNT